MNTKKRGRPKLSIVDLAVGLRVKEARELLGISQGAFAAQIGIPIGTLSNYESGVSPLKVELGLKICREWIISEEWLATGKYEIAKAIGKSKNIIIGEDDEGITGLEYVFFRQCMNLATHPAAKKLLRMTNFAAAFESSLAQAYAERLEKNFLLPSIEWSTEEVDLAKRFLMVLIDRRLEMSRLSSLKKGEGADNKAQLLVQMLIKSVLMYSKYLGTGKLTHRDWQAMAWLRNILKEPSLDGSSSPSQPGGPRDISEQFKALEEALARN